MNANFDEMLNILSVEEINLIINDKFLTAQHKEYKGNYKVTDNDLIDFAYTIIKKSLKKSNPA